MDLRAPGTTLITGPVGYGKTSLASEITQRHSERTFWYTMVDEDSPKKFNAHVIQSVRNVLPDFAPWFESEPTLNPSELIVRFSNELETYKGEYIFIVDNRRTSAAADFATANEIIRSLPRNLHLIHIRRFTPHASVAELAPTGNLHTIGPAELRLTSDEVGLIANLHGIAPLSDEHVEILKSAQGWPAAVQLISRGLAKGVKFNPSAEDISKSSEPLRLIVEEFVKGLSPSEQKLLKPLSAVKRFTSELAQRILEEDYSQHMIDALAAEGSILTKSNDHEAIYQLHSLIGEYLYRELQKDEKSCRKAHGIASAFYEENLEPTLALEHAFNSKDLIRFERLFRSGARSYSVTGRGRELLHWAKYAGDESVEGQLKRQTVEVAGHFANLDFVKVGALLASMRLQAQGTVLQNFIDRYCTMIEVATDTSFGRFDNLFDHVAKVLEPDDMAADIDHTDSLFALRRLAGLLFLTDQLEELEKINAQAETLLADRFSPVGHIHQLAIRALCSYLEGNYHDAYEASRMSLSLSEKMGAASIYSPDDARFILARCNHEFTDTQASTEIFNQVLKDSQNNQQWVWYCATISFLGAHIAQIGNVEGGLELVRGARERISSIHNKNNLARILDRGELVIRFVSGDLEQMRLLIKTALEGKTVELVKLHILRAEGKEWDPAKTQVLPERTPRQKIYKLLSATVHAMENDEEAALAYLTDALRLGVEVGAKAIFVRQVELHPLFHKIALTSPTFYHEDISRKAAARMQEINAARNIKPELTKREIEIVGHLDSGKPITAIGASLHISHNTMKTHLKNIYRKLAVDGRDQAVEKSKALGLITI